MTRRAGCGKPARPDLWGAGDWNLPGLPDHEAVSSCADFQNSLAAVRPEGAGGRGSSVPAGVVDVGHPGGGFSPGAGGGRVGGAVGCDPLDDARAAGASGHVRPRGRGRGPSLAPAEGHPATLTAATDLEGFTSAAGRVYRGRAHMLDGVGADGHAESAGTAAQTALIAAPAPGSDDALVEEALAHIRRIWSHGLLATVVALGDRLLTRRRADDLTRVDVPSPSGAMPAGSVGPTASRRGRARSTVGAARRGPHGVVRPVAEVPPPPRARRLHPARLRRHERPRARAGPNGPSLPGSRRGRRVPERPRRRGRAGCGGLSSNETDRRTSRRRRPGRG